MSFLGGFFDGLMLDGTAVHKNFKSGKGSGRMKQVAAEVEHLTKSYDERAERLSGIAKKMEAAFTGDVGDAAASSMLPMMRTLRYSGQQMDVTKALTEHQAQMWHDADNSVVEVPPAPEKPSAWSQGFKRITFQGGDADAADAAYEAGVARREAANQHNIDVYNSYSSGTGSVSSSIPGSYPELRDTGGDIDIAQHRGTPGDGRKFGTPDIGNTAASSVSGPSGGVGSSVSGTPGVQGSGGSLGGGGGLQPGAQTGVGGVSTNPAGGIGTGPGGGGGRPVGSGPIIGGPIAGGPIGGGGDDTRRSPSRSGGAAARLGGAGKLGGGSAGAQLAGTGSGAGGPKGAAGGPGAGTGAPKAGGGPLAGGKGVGVGGGPGGGAAAAAQAAKAGAGGGRGGMGGMAGAGGGKGQGGEDKEHKRADFLQENDPESLFGTDEKTAPPVIGDPAFDPSKDPRAGR